MREAMDKAKEVTGEVVDKTTEMLTKLSCAGKRKEAANNVKVGLDSAAVASQAQRGRPSALYTHVSSPIHASNIRRIASRDVTPAKNWLEKKVYQK